MIWIVIVGFIALLILEPFLTLTKSDYSSGGARPGHLAPCACYWCREWHRKEMAKMEYWQTHGFTPLDESLRPLDEDR